jgi:hypothetical protein
VNYLLIGQVLRNVLNVISGVPGATAQGDGQPVYFPQVGTGPITDGNGHDIGTISANNDQARVTYDVISENTLGFDEWRDTYDPDVVIPGDTYTGPGAPLGGVITTVSGNRELVVQVKVECFEQSDGKGPMPIASAIRTRFGLPTIVEALTAAEIAQQMIRPTITTSYDDENGRRVSVAMFEIVFNGADSADDDPVTTIETIGMPKPPTDLQVNT